MAEKINTLLPIKFDTIADAGRMNKAVFAEDLLDRMVVRVDTTVGNNFIERTPYFLRLSGITLPF